jgi:hypothetical protein
LERHINRNADKDRVDQIVPGNMLADSRSVSADNEQEQRGDDGAKLRALR